MKNYFISLGKRLVWILLFFLGIPIMIVPYFLVYLFCGGNIATNMMEKLEDFFVNLLD